MKKGSGKSSIPTQPNDVDTGEHDLWLQTNCFQFPLFGILPIARDELDRS